jgi:hypothetical protein
MTKEVVGDNGHFHCRSRDDGGDINKLYQVNRADQPLAVFGD